MPQCPWCSLTARSLPPTHLRKHGKTPADYMPYRFWEKVQRKGPDECWPWLAALNAQTGYGRFQMARGAESAHVIAYLLAGGLIPKGKHLDHLCRNRWCVNPRHLEPVSLAENVMRGEGVAAVNARKTHCSRGHEFTADNTYHGSGSGHGTRRACRTCRAAASAKDYRRLKESKARAREDQRLAA